MDLMLITNSAHYVKALKEEEGVVEELQHLPELQLFEAEIRIRLLMGIVMISTIFYPAIMMGEIAVDLMSIQIGAQYVNALKEEEEGVVEELQHLPELQLPEVAIGVGLLMGIVMISTTI